jgi:hypothetical protein
MLHSASQNNTRIPRIITNPPVSLLKPFQYSRPDSAYSLVELKTLSELGVDGTKGEGYDFKITTERRGVVPERLERQAREKREAEKRLAELRAAGTEAGVEHDSGRNGIAVPA